MWTLFILIESLLCLLCQYQVLGENVQNSTVCFSGGKGFMQAKCTDDQSQTTLDFIGVKNLYFGSKLKPIECESDNQTCCLLNETTDCIYRTNKHLTSMVQACTGQLECNTQIRSLFNGKNCPVPKLYRMTSQFAVMEYNCINIGQMTDMCHEGIVFRDKSVYINSNIFHKNNDIINSSCSCVVTANCGNKLQINAIDVRLTTNRNNSQLCDQELTITDGRSNRNETITCKDKDIHSFKPIFTSESNIVYVDLTATEENLGKVWLEVKGAEDESILEVRCGDNVHQPINDNHACDEDKITTVFSDGSTTADVSESTTECIDCLESSGSGLSAGVIGGVSTAVVFILIILVVILILVFRSRRTMNDENIYSTAIEQENGTVHYEELPETLPETWSDQATGISNPIYLKSEKNHIGTEYDNIQNHGRDNTVEYDNVGNYHQDNSAIDLDVPLSKHSQ